MSRFMSDLLDLYRSTFSEEEAKALRKEIDRRIEQLRKLANSKTK